MSLKIYNTLQREKEVFVPAEGNTVRMYVCGVTVYDDCHLGHARAYVSFDVVRRYLEYKGYRVKHLQNFTDIDDKVIAKARTYKEELSCSYGRQITLKEAAKFIAEKYIQEYFKYMDKLSVKRATLFPKATEHIPEMIELIEGLMKNGYAYTVEGDVFFSVEKFPSYGKLSCRKLNEMRPGARVDVDERKRHPLDFVLWKKAKEEEPSWESPWGEGRPGWHIECSAMSIKYLGESFDIHGGGQDLIFPHHENEIAQSEGYTGKPFARYWLHNGFVTINREKMSKSLGNFFTLREIFERYDPLAVRLFLISTHYRHPIDFSDDELGKSVRKLERLKECDRKIRNLQVKTDSPAQQESLINEATTKIDHRSCSIHRAKGVLYFPMQGESSKFLKEFENHMDNDFNTPGALGVIFDMVRHINTEIDKGRAKGADFARVVDEFEKLLEVLGLPMTEEVQHLQVRRDEIDESKSLSDEEIEKLLSLGENLSNSEIEELVIQRELARRNGSWEEADRIRTRLSKFLRIQDTTEGTVWKRL